MKLYTHAVTQKMISDLYAAYDAVRGYNKQYSEYKRIYQPEKLKEKESELLGSFRMLAGNLHDKVAEARKELKKAAAESMAKYVSLGNAEEDFKILALNVALTADDLAIMVERNAGNHLFYNTARAFMNDHNIAENKAFTAAKNKHIDAAGSRNHEEKAERLVDYFRGSIPTENMIYNESDLNLGYECFNALEDKNSLLSDLDAGI